MELSMAIKSEKSHGEGITSELLMEIFIGTLLFPMVEDDGNFKLMTGKRSNASECIGIQLIRCWSEV